MGIIRAICTSEKRGTVKKEVQKAHIDLGWGLRGDAHGGNWHRQISLLSYDKVQAFKEQGAEVDHGAFGENLLVEGIDFAKLPVGTLLSVGEAVLEVTQIGKECHSHCEIYQRMGDCIMPREGIFTQVIHGGIIQVGDEMNLLEAANTCHTAAILTLSDKGHEGKRTDESGPIIQKQLEQQGYRVMDVAILPDDHDAIADKLVELTDQTQVDLILTTGGTGFSPRDVTPEATLSISDRLVPGIQEAIRAYSMTITKRAMLSRAVSVIRGKTLIINLPGSPKAVTEILDYILPEISHGIEILKQTTSECARD